MSVRKVVTRPITLTTGGTPVNILVGTANEPNSLAPRYRVTGTQTLSVGNFTIVPLGTPYTDETVEILWEASATLSGNSIAVFGVTIPAGWETLNWASKHVYNGSAWITYLTPDFETTAFVLTDDIADLAITTGKIAALAVTTAKLEAGGAGVGVTNAKMAEMPTVTIKGNDGAGPAVPQDLTMTEVRTILDQDVTLTGDVTGTATQTFATGVTTIATTIANDAVETTMIADYQVTVAKVENNLTYELITLLVSFEAAGGTTPSVGDFKIKMPYPGTVSEIYAYAVKAIAATDNGTIVAKNNAGTTMTSGTITYTASDARGTAYTITPSANNTFIAGDILTFTTAKATAGGLVELSIKITRS